MIGAGQAGIAASEHLTRVGISHIVLERDRIVESWRTRRWDSLVANGPAWHDRFPGLEFSIDGDGFASKEMVTQYFEEYARKFKVPVRTSVEVKSVTRNFGRPGFVVEAANVHDAGVKPIKIEALYVISATGAYQTPIIPQIVPQSAGLLQIHSIDYRNPSQLPEGAVLVVGAGSSGAQIADELGHSGRKTYLSVGPHGRPPRSYRERDFCWWLGVLNLWDKEATGESRHTTIAVSGANGGRTMDFRELASRENGVTLAGRTMSFENGNLLFAQDLAKNIKDGDNNYLQLLDAADAYVEQNGLDLPEDPEARTFSPDPPCVVNPIHELNLAEHNITSIIWATGFSNSYAWLQTSQSLVEGRPSHHRGISTEPGVYFLGLPWQTRRGSSFIWGVWYDAGYIADHIKKQQQYVHYRPSASSRN